MSSTKSQEPTSEDFLLHKLLVNLYVRYSILLVESREVWTPQFLHRYWEVKLDIQTVSLQNPVLWSKHCSVWLLHFEVASTFPLDPKVWGRQSMRTCFMSCTCQHTNIHTRVREQFWSSQMSLKYEVTVPGLTSLTPDSTIHYKAEGPLRPQIPIPFSVSYFPAFFYSLPPCRIFSYDLCLSNFKLSFPLIGLTAEWGFPCVLWMYVCIVKRNIDINRCRYIDRDSYRYIDNLLLVFSKDYFIKVCPSW